VLVCFDSLSTRNSTNKLELILDGKPRLMPFSKERPPTLAPRHGYVKVLPSAVPTCAGSNRVLVSHYILCAHAPQIICPSLSFPSLHLRPGTNAR